MLRDIFLVICLSVFSATLCGKVNGLSAFIDGLGSSEQWAGYAMDMSGAFFYEPSGGVPEPSTILVFPAGFFLFQRKQLRLCPRKN